MQTEVVLGIGGNKGDRADFLLKTIEALSQQVTLIGYSQIYETEVWGGVAKMGNFLNQVVCIQTHLNPNRLLEVIQVIEAQLGRTREQHWGDRTIDIDILYFGEQVWDTPSLRIPHPYLEQRRFVLQPLAEILPEKKHPILGKTTLELLNECNDLGQVSFWRQEK
ncbi:MAG: 2-amino-4-hydroxy-6-hydroxymethyldihydropteridine diphosphokinase [Bacteroidetes bacterium]|nr:2-amino-4-hydroxy-6-hydroxymethyldihydropteridine diphosphokinase [Bacteroidota bacterium]